MANHHTETMQGLEGRRAFGTTPDGDEIDEVTITSGELTAKIINRGAALRDLRLQGSAHPLVLGFETLENYLLHSPHFGATPGRFSNRIDQGHFILNGQAVQLGCNENGNHLHGGASGFGKRVWSIDEVGEHYLLMSIDSPDGEEGYPGNFHASCRYEVRDASLVIDLKAVCDQPCPANLTHHSYFNLDDAMDCLGHEAQILADRYTPVREDMIPTGELKPVEGTPFDFRQWRTIRSEMHASDGDFDHNFVISDMTVDVPRPIARVRGAQSGIELEVWSNQPAVQFYTGFKLNPPVPGLDGRRYVANGGFCLEPQVHPDAPNHAAFADCILQPGTVYHHQIEYRFRQTNQSGQTIY